MSAATRLTRTFTSAPSLPLTDYSRYVLFSDCHRGTGTVGDNFLKNQHLYFAALQHYYQQGYTYIELGDGDELWENRSMAQIKSSHNDVFALLSRYYHEGRLYLLYGNHDMIKKYPKFTTCNCVTYPCHTCGEKELFPGITFYSGLILEDQMGHRNLYLTHGHQADFFNCVLWKCSRFLVRYVWKPLEQRGVLDPTSAARNNTKKQKLEQTLADWAASNDCILITGHTHRPMIGHSGSPYCNCGSCVHPSCITCIEVTNRCLTLVKWMLTAHTDMSLYVAREALTESFCIDDIPASLK